ncbi:hypothetical protein GCK72_024248 [Caenorhabditis remanei]|uniref:Uncharacterized protein n=1 Tax=Caenorhabditis remanei TaxID=31234 RepID=A0A6A5FZA7_CAERE|nr:hypothetical protein GCK72_024248 [Caenorhabditis remanei]KAF1747782.1 hypothetical protein GCK72_024248 [Caenorhabditis remanei]
MAVCINMDIVKAIYILILIVWSGFLFVLLCTLIREWFFPEPKHLQKIEEEKDYVPPPKYVSLDVADLEKTHGLEIYQETSDTLPLLPI